MTLRLGIAALASLCLVAAGCGGGAGTQVVAGEPISFEELSRSANSSAEVTSGRFAFDMELSIPGLDDQQFAFSGEGAFDAASERAALSVDMSSFAALLGGLFAGFAGADTEGTPDFDDPSGWQIDAIQDGDVSYIRFPAVDDQLPSGKSWIRTDGTSASGNGFELSQLDQFTKNDPRELLDVLRAATGEIEVVGAEELRGVETTHYRATIDPSDVERLATPEERKEAASLTDELFSGTGLDEIPVDVWIDGDGLVRKFATGFSATDPATSQEGSVSVSFELWDLGEDVDIELPPASQVVDESAVRS